MNKRLALVYVLGSVLLLTAFKLPPIAAFFYGTGGTVDVNNQQIAGTTLSVNNGTVDAGTQRVTLASNSTGQVALATGANTVGAVTQGAGSGNAANYWYTRETDGTNPVVLDPCRTQANIFTRISQTANTQIITGTSAKKIYICSINLVTAGANNVAIVEGTGTVCATGIAGVSTGGTTAATGWNFAANGGLTQGNGMGSIMAEATNADNLCILQSAAVQLSGVIGYVVQ
jgi:hypothetical protein